MTQFPNIVWLLVDSIRNYPTDQDLRGKLPVMEEFGKQSVEFTSCVTTAPSTIMSITAMMSGYPAYFLARNYDDFRFDNQYYTSLAGVLKQHGYTSYAFLRGPQTREKFQTLLDPVPRKFWSPHLRHGRKWTNADLNDILDRVVAHGIEQPAFLFFHFNPKTRSENGDVLEDPEISDRVAYAWNTLMDAGFTRDNTIYVMSSDHGFPDPSTGMTSEWEAKHRLRHDLVLTDDNILIPLYIQYPGCTPKKITTPVSALDISPTLLDLADIPRAHDIARNTDGVSLVPLIQADGEATYERQFFRCDSRLMLQTGRSTAIRSHNYKYIRFHDEHRVLRRGHTSTLPEVLVDLEQDPGEEHNLLLDDPLPADVNDVLQQFRTEFERSERRALQFHIEYLLARQRTEILGRHETGTTADALLVFEPNTASYTEIGLRAVSSGLPGASVDVLSSVDLPSHTDDLNVRRTFEYERTDDGELIIQDTNGRGTSETYDLLFLFVQDPAAPIVDKLLNLTHSLDVKHHYLLDCNFNVYHRRSYWYYRIRAFLDRLPYFFEEPTYLLLQLKIASRLIARRLLQPLGLWEHWNQTREHLKHNNE